MSRRDEALSAVDDLVRSFRTQLNQALEGENPQPSTRRGSVPLGARLAAAFPAPTSSSAPPTPAASANSPSAFLRQPLGTSTPFSSGASHSSYPIDPVRLDPSAAGSSSQHPFPTSTSRDGAPLNDDGDALPGYSRRVPVAPYLTSGLPAKRLHVLASKTGKLNLQLHARGKEQVVLVQELPDGDVALDGVLQVVLREPETITHIRVRLKGMVRTLVQKAHASGRHPVSDEVEFFEDGRVLWTAPSNGGAPEYLPGNTSSDPLKLQGTFTFPFSLVLPGRLTQVPEMDLPPGRAIRPPPSFMLDSSTAQPAGGHLTVGVGAFEASCRYFLKVTLGRKGLLKMNERWIVPVVFVPRQPPPSPSPLRTLALREGRRPPSAASDPEGWSEPGKYVARVGTKRGVWKSKTGWVEVEGRVPRPQKFVKGQGQSIDFEVQITSDANGGRFPASAIAVSLLQRTVVTAQRLLNTLDTVVLRAQAVRPIGAPDGLPVQLGNGQQAWRVTYGGSIKLTQGMTPSFRAPNLQVLYELCVTLYQPGPRPDLITHTHIASLGIPVEIVSCAPASSSSSAPARPPPPPQPVAPPPPAAPMPATQPPPLPPRLDSSSAGSGPAAAGSTASSSASSAAPPAAAPPHTSEDIPAYAGLDASAGAGAGAGASGEGARTPAGVDADEERRLEEEWGMPPSYFDVVGEERR
ncbi:hypothetical protein JCM10449v2_004661 [Rhodotorula kratochvilovae]